MMYKSVVLVPSSSHAHLYHCLQCSLASFVIVVVVVVIIQRLLTL